MITINGADMAAPCPSSAAAQCLAANGYEFVGRYYSVNQWKVLTADEAQMLCGAGLALVALYEDGGTDFSTAQGEANAATALEQAAAAGQPAGSAVYFAVDYDAGADDISGSIIPYFRAIRPVLTKQLYAVGVYGSGLVCSSLLNAGLVTYTWLSQSTDFQGSSSYTTWTIHQLPTITLYYTSEGQESPLTVDPDVAQSFKYGSFTVATTQG